jgi:hypothetical protein
MAAYAIHEPRKFDGLWTRTTVTVTLFSEQFPVFLYWNFSFGHSVLAPEGLLRSVNGVDATPRRYPGSFAIPPLPSYFLSTFAEILLIVET